MGIEAVSPGAAACPNMNFCISGASVTASMVAPCAGW